MRNTMLNSTFMTQPLWAPEVGAGGGGGEGGGDGGAGAAAAPEGGAAAAAEPESILFPSEGGDKDKPADPPAGEGEKPGKEGEGAGDKPADKPGDIDPKDLEGKVKDDAPKWEDYKPDPNKTDEENARLKAEHDKTKPADGDDQFPVPEKYELAMPEGIELDAGLLEAVTPIFKDLLLTNEQAQALTDKFIEHRKAEAEKYMASPEGAWSAQAHQYFTDNGTPDKWAETAKNDAEIGGTKWDDTVAASTRAVSKLGTPELRAYLSKSGGGNHPELIRFMAKVGAMIGEDNPANGGAGGDGKPAEPAHVLFPNDAPKG